MLDIIFGSNFCPGCIMDNRIWYSRNKKPEWFEEDFSKRVLKAIDKADVLFEEALKDRWGHGISTEQISTGSKSLISIKHNPSQYFNGSLMGDNCVPFLLEIARETDVHIMLEHLMDIPEDVFNVEHLVRVDGDDVDYEEYISRQCDWAEWVDRCSYDYYEIVADGGHVTMIKPLTLRMTCQIPFIQKLRERMLETYSRGKADGTLLDVDYNFKYLTYFGELFTGEDIYISEENQQKIINEFSPHYGEKLSDEFWHDLEVKYKTAGPTEIAQPQKMTL